MKAKQVKILKEMIEECSRLQTIKQDAERAYTDSVRKRDLFMEQIYNELYKEESKVTHEQLSRLSQEIE